MNIDLSLDEMLGVASDFRGPREFLDSAVTIARLDYRVIPLEPNGKRPIVKAWPAVATTDVAQIHRWWLETPNANIGIACGQGLLVLDFDVKSGGLESLAKLRARGMRAPTVATPSGGRHLYLRYDGDDVTVSAGKIAGYPGVDVRCRGGYVVGPGSSIDGVRYALVDE